MKERKDLVTNEKILFFLKIKYKFSFYSQRNCLWQISRLMIIIGEFYSIKIALTDENINNKLPAIHKNKEARNFKPGFK